MIDGERVDGHKTAGSTETKGKHNVIIDKTNRQRPRPSTATKGRQQMPDHDVIPALKGRRDGFALCRIWSDGQLPPVRTRAVG